MISVIEGRPGTGKTVFLVMKIVNYLNRGLHVYTNVDLNLRVDDIRFPLYHYIESLEDIVDIREGKVVLDEIQTYLNSRNWDKLDVKFQLLLQQHRKRGLDIIGATQSVKRADIVFRELVHYFYTVSKLFSVTLFGDTYGMFILREYDPDSIDVNKEDRAKYRMGMPIFLTADPYIFKIYDTTQEMSFDDGIGKYETVTHKVIEKPARSLKFISKVIEDRSVPQVKKVI